RLDDLGQVTSPTVGGFRAGRGRTACLTFGRAGRVVPFHLAVPVPSDVTGRQLAEHPAGCEVAEHGVEVPVATHRGRGGWRGHDRASMRWRISSWASRSRCCA